MADEQQQKQTWFQTVIEFLKSIGKAIAKPADFFKEAGTGQLSSTRLMAFEVVNVGLFIAVNSTLGGKTVDSNTLALIFGLVTLGLTGKLIAKPLEAKGNGDAPASPAQ